MQSKVCSLWLLDEKSKVLKIRATQTMSQEYLRERSLRLGQGVVGYVASERKPAIILDVLKDPRFKEEHGQPKNHAGHRRSYYSSPRDPKVILIPELQTL